MESAQTSERSDQRAKSARIGKPFEKGKSGNPGGRPRVPDDVREAAKALTALALDTLEKIIRDDETPAAARVTACEAVLNRAWGKPAQAVELTGKDGGAILTEETGMTESARRIAYLLSAAAQGTS